MTMTLPEYSSSLVTLVRGYDRAELAAFAATAHLEDQPHAHGDGGSVDFAHQRVRLLEKQLKPMRQVINAMIQSESCQQKQLRAEDFQFDRRSNLLLPDLLLDVLSPYGSPKFYYNDTQDGVSAAAAYANENYVLLFEDEGYVIPRSIPKSVIEIWWRRLFYDDTNQSFYQMALVENDAYGWDVFGHER